MWSKTFKPPGGGGDGKAKRDVAMSAQAQLILRKKAEIEAKMAQDLKPPGEKEKKERKPISLSINKRWGLKGKKDGTTTESTSSGSPSSTNTGNTLQGDNPWGKYSTSTESQPPPINFPSTISQSQPSQSNFPQSISSFLPSTDPGFLPQPQQLPPTQQIQSIPLDVQPPPGISYQTSSYDPRVGMTSNATPVVLTNVSTVGSQQGYISQPPPGPPPIGVPPIVGLPAVVAPPPSVNYDIRRPPPGAQQFTSGGPPQFDAAVQHQPPPIQQQFVSCAGPMLAPPTLITTPQIIQLQPTPQTFSSPIYPPNISTNPLLSHGPPQDSHSMQLPHISSTVHSTSAAHYNSLIPTTIQPPSFPSVPSIVESSNVLQSAPVTFVPSSSQPSLISPQTLISSQTISHVPPPISQPPPPILSQLPPLSSHPPPIGQQLSSHPPPIGQQLSSHPPPIGQQMTSHPPPIGQQMSSHPPPIGQQLGSHPPTIGQHFPSQTHPSPIPSHPPPAIHQLPPLVSHPPPSINHPPPQVEQFPGVTPPTQPPPGVLPFGPTSHSPTDLSFPPPLPNISHPPPNSNFPPPQQATSGPGWWNDTIAKVKETASNIGGQPPRQSFLHEVEPPRNVVGVRENTGDGLHASDQRGRQGFSRQFSDDGQRRRGTTEDESRRRSSTEEKKGNQDNRSWRDKDTRRSREEDRGHPRDRRSSQDHHESRRHDRGPERRPRSPGGTNSPRQRVPSPHNRSRSRHDSKDSDRSHHRERTYSGTDSRGDRIKEEHTSKRKFKEEREPVPAVKTEPRDIDLRPKKEPGRAESYSPTRPDYQPTTPSGGVKIEPSETLPSVVEELASMVAVSGEDLEDIARDRNQNTPELRFLFEKSGPLYRRYRARVAELKGSFDPVQDVKPKIEPQAFVKAEVKVEEATTKKRKSRWGKQETDVDPPKMMAVSTPVIPPVGIGAPGVAIPTQLGGMVQKLVTPQTKLTELNTSNPALVAYAKRVFGGTDLSDSQWKQCEDQLKMSVVYGQMASKQAAANARQTKGKNKMEYDSDEETEGGTWEHRARALEMEKTLAEASNSSEVSGGHHIGDFLPSEELSKFMNKYKAMSSGTAWDNSEYQENKLGQDNVGFKMLQKMGWSGPGVGLGAGGSGILNPIGKSGAGSERQGLGTVNPGEIQADDDEFDTYRKRMMLAYRFRPNPMNNPRRAYY